MREISVASKTPDFPRPSNNLFVVAAGLVSAGLLYLGTGLHPIWWVLWVAPVPVLAISPRLNSLAAFLLGSIAWFLGELNQWNYMRHVIDLPSHIVIVFFVTAAVVFGLGLLFTRSFLRRGSVFLAAIAFPVYWVSCEYLNAMTSPHSTWGNLAYTQMDFLPVIQIASVTGLWGISFVLFFFAGTVATLVSGAGKPWKRGALMITAGCLISAVLLFGEWRLQFKPLVKSVSVTLVAKDVPMSLYLGSEEQTLELLREYTDEIHRVAPTGTQAVVLPEKIGRVGESALTKIDAMFSSAATTMHAAIVVGLVRKTPSAAFNSARLYLTNGLQGNYDKHHLIPGIEPEQACHGKLTIDQSSSRWGLQICKDMDFPALSREYGTDGDNLMLVPAWDFVVDGWLHSRMAVMRAVENGFAVARSARNGLLTLSDSRGRIVAETATVPGRFVSISGILNVAPEGTFYTQAGDWFAWLCVVVFVVLLASRLLMRSAIA